MNEMDGSNGASPSHCTAEDAHPTDFQYGHIAFYFKF